jgi:hypothetical protein
VSSIATVANHDCGRVDQDSTPKRVGTVRILLVGLGVPAVVIGAWAAFAPRSFYEDFPGFGQVWVRPDGPFNEHLVRDFGDLNLALAFVTLAAVVWCTPLLARLVAGAWLVEGIPHLVYHLRHLDPLASDAKVGSIAGLAIVPVVALVLLAMVTSCRFALQSINGVAGTRLRCP